MKNEFESKLAVVKENLKALLDDKDLDTSTINEIAKIDKDLDEVKAEHDTLVKQHSELKEQLIGMIKTTSFKTPSDDSTEEEPKTLDEIIGESYQEVMKSQK